MERFCVKHGTFRPCQQCAKADIWGGQELIFKRDAENRIQELEQQLEDAETELSRAKHHNTWMQKEVERLRSALEKIARLEDNMDGKVTLRSLQEIAEQALKGDSTSSQQLSELDRSILDKTPGR